jgi:serine/threonine protein kinase
MSITVGSRLGPYEILSAIGAGGMGEVYKARDTRLDRTVAIKVLPDHFASDPQFRERFDREARAVAALSHPHICTLYDIGSQDGVNFLVMEYLEGETLADRLKKGALPLDQSLQCAIQIADALDNPRHQDDAISVWQCIRYEPFTGIRGSAEDSRAWPQTPRPSSPLQPFTTPNLSAAGVNIRDLKNIGIEERTLFVASGCEAMPAVYSKIT